LNLVIVVFKIDKMLNAEKVENRRVHKFVATRQQGVNQQLFRVLKVGLQGASCVCI